METLALKIVIPVDGSENALRAVHHAIRLAGSGAVLDCFLLNVQEPMELHVHAYKSQQDIKLLEAAVAERALAPASQILSSAGISNQQAYVVGEITHSIITYAEENQCNGIIMGMRGMGIVVGPVTMGSVTSKMVHEARIPVTLVK